MATTRIRRNHNARSEVVERSLWKPFVANDRRSALVTVAATPTEDAERIPVVSSTGRHYTMSIASLLDAYHRLTDAEEAEKAAADVFARNEALNETMRKIGAANLHYGPPDKTPGFSASVTFGENQPPTAPLPNGLRHLPAEVTPPAEPSVDEAAPAPAATAWVQEPALAAMKVRDVDGWALGYQADGDEPLIRDIDLGERLGYERPRDVRKLIDRLVDTGKIDGVYVRATTARTSMPRGGYREEEVREAWLSEEQALLVVTASETSRAIALTREIVRVFMAARRGALALPSPAAAANDPRIDRLVGAVERVTGTVEQLVGLVTKVVEAGLLGRGEPPPAPAPATVPPPPPSGTQRVVAVAPKGWMGARDIATWLSGRLQTPVSEKRVNKVIAALKLRERRPAVATRIRTTRVDALGDTHEHPKWTYSPSILRELEEKIREGMSGPLFDRKGAPG